MQPRHSILQSIKTEFSARAAAPCSSPHPSMHGAEIQLVKSDITTNFATGHCTFIA